MLKWSKKFEWMDKCQQAFLTLKEHLGCSPLLSSQEKGKISTYASLFLRWQLGKPWSGRMRKYISQSTYMSKRHLDAKTRYLELEKLALTLMVASRKLMPYFHAHPIEVLTN